MIKIDGQNVIMSEQDKGKETYSYFVMKKLLKNAGLSLTKAAEMMFENHPEHKTSMQNVQSKLSRDAIRFTEFCGLAEACGYSVSFNKIKNKSDENQSKNENTIDKLEDETYNQLMKEISKGFDIVEGVHFDCVVYVGENSTLAAEWTKDKLNLRMDTMMELSIYAMAKHRFNVICSPITLDDSILDAFKF